MNAMKKDMIYVKGCEKENKRCLKSSVGPQEADTLVGDMYIIFYKIRQSQLKSPS